MSEKEINFKDLNKFELEILKDNYVASRLACMTEADLIAFAKAVIEDQVKGTVGNEEEKEAWEEIKEHFKENFDLEIKKVIKPRKGDHVNTSPEEEEFAKRLDLLKERQIEQDKNDMW